MDATAVQQALAVLPHYLEALFAALPHEQQFDLVVKLIEETQILMLRVDVPLPSRLSASTSDSLSSLRGMTLGEIQREVATGKRVRQALQSLAPLVDQMRQAAASHPDIQPVFQKFQSAIEAILSAYETPTEGPDAPN